MAKTTRADMRLDEETQDLIKRLSDHLGVNRTSVVKLAVRELARKEGLGRRETAMLTFNSNTGNYEAPVNGGTLIVEGDFFSESYPDGELDRHPEAYSVDTWLNVENGEEVRIERN